MYFLDDIKAAKADCIVTYGSSSSNHCRIIANMATSLGMKCVIISPAEDEENTFNLTMMQIFNAQIVKCSVSQVSETIDNTLVSLKDQGFSPYFIMGGGHGNLGTQAYVDCFAEIMEYEKENSIHFDYIFHASGTGTTQAGLICGKILNKSDSRIVGISIARKNPRGGQVVAESVQDYMTSLGREGTFVGSIEFVDDYVLDGYGKFNKDIDDTIADVIKDFGIPLNRTYTGKAFWGMGEYLAKEEIRDKNILFIHTGGTPLFFDYIRGM